MHRLPNRLSPMDLRNVTRPDAAWRAALHFAVSDGVPRRSLRIAAVVGSILNLINQGDALFDATAVNWWKFCLTYLVPYLVSTYGVVAFRLARLREASDAPPRRTV